MADVVVVPEKNDIVLCRVISIGYALTKVVILCVNNSKVKQPLYGIIRREEIRATERDSVSVFNSYHPCDIIRARVLSIGDTQGYTLTTAENELGVILAKSTAGGHMIPISWCEMQCTCTGIREKRKVAKVLNALSF